jgi:hypothetical protein
LFEPWLALPDEHPAANAIEPIAAAATTPRANLRLSTICLRLLWQHARPDDAQPGDSPPPRVNLRASAHHQDVHATLARVAQSVKTHVPKVG